MFYFTDFRALEAEESETTSENSFNRPVDNDDTENETHNENNDIITGNEKTHHIIIFININSFHH